MNTLNRLCYIALFGCVIALLISINTCQKHADNEKGSHDYIASLNDTIVHLKNGVVKKKVVQVTKADFENIVKERDDLKKALEIANIKARNVNSFTGITTAIDIGKAPIVAKLKDSIICQDFDSVAFRASNNDYRVSGEVLKGSVRFDTINFPDSVSIITATTSHLFKPSECNVLIKHSNGLVKTVGAVSITVSDERKWWQRGIVKVIASFLAGSYLTYRLTH